MNHTLKIAVCYHRPAYIPQGDCFIPMWCGKAVAEQITKEGSFLSAKEILWLKQHCLGDDEGDNISALNRKYSEVSALYWLWKNYNRIGNPDYLGILQYRRLFLPDSSFFAPAKPDYYNQIYIESFSNEIQQKISLNEQTLQNLLTKYEGIFAANDTGKTLRYYQENHYSQNPKYYHEILNIINHSAPKFAEAATRYDRETWHAWSNCFVMKKEHFFAYCEFLFPILQKIDEFAKDDYDSLNTEQQRIPGYAAETLLGIYWTYLKSQGCKFCNLPLIYARKPFINL